MRDATRLKIPGDLHLRLQQHLVGFDDLEAAALLICTRTAGASPHYLAKELILVPHKECRIRKDDFISWPGEYLEQAIDQAEATSSSIFLVHSHPGGLLDFSEVDDQSDARVIPCLHQGIEVPHGSAIMVSDGTIIARIYQPGMECQTIDAVAVFGDDISFWRGRELFANSSHRRPLAFTTQMTSELSELSAAVVGISGIGSIVAEQLARLGFGKLLLVDFDRIEARNLNRIVNASTKDAEVKRLKVDMFAESIARHREEDTAIPLPASITTREAVLAASECDILFSCVDTLEARQICDLISSRFLIPLFDAGVTIPTRKTATSHAIADVCGRIDYVQPGGSTLGDRGVYTPEALRAEHLREVAPEAHEEELRAGYIKGLHEEAPAVITLNMRAASGLVNEFLARAYPFRLDSNREYARTQFSLAACEEEYHSEDSFEKVANEELALGDAEPLLGLPSLGRRVRA